MANKTISELTEATVVNEQDLFVLEQSGLAKKMTAETFITAQNLVSALATALDGHGGISSVTLSSVSGRIRTYRITFADASTTTFQVYDGTTIERIAKTSEAGLVSTYTIFMSDGTTSFFNVSNGADGDVSEATLNSELAKKAPVITETVSSTAIATFADGADDMPIQSLVAEFEPIQNLSNGDPSPTNICPITGHTEVEVTRTGKNLIPNLKAQDTAKRVRLGESTVGNGIPLKAGTYTISETLSSGVTAICYWRTYDVNTGTNGTTHNSHTITLTEDTNVKIWLYNSSGVDASDVLAWQGELGSSATTYEAYVSPTTVTVSLGGTYYGGTLDVATGVLTVTDAVIDSYAGETLPSTWISDRDVYAEGTTPTTGAQVVYELATSQTYQLSGQQLKTLYGNNTVWADGNVTVKYPADTKMYIDNAIAALA